MKNHVVTLLLLVAAAQGAAAEHLVLVPARGLPAAAVRPVLAGALDHILNRVAPGTIVSVVDPVDHALQATFTVPAGPARARAANHDLKAAIPALCAAFENHPPVSEWERGAVALPEVVRFVRERLTNPSDRVNLILIGDPKYRSAPGVFDFTNGCVPSDAWLTADPTESPYATGSNGHLLDGWGVFVVVLPATWAATDWQRTEVERFWTLFAQRQGAGLLLGDVNLVFAKLGQGVPRNPAVRPLDPADRALVFRNKVFVRGQSVEVSQKANDAAPAAPEPPVAEAPIAPVSVPVVETPPPAAIPVIVENQTVAPAVVQATPVAEPPPLPFNLMTRLNAIPRAAPSTMVVSLVWENDAHRRSGSDIDAYVTINRVEGELYYRTMRIPQHGPPVASLRKDITDARGLQASGADFEQVTVHQPVSPSDVTLWLDVYNNSSRAPLTVALRFEYGGRTYLKTVCFPGMSGDQAANRRKRAASPQWQRVDLAALVQEGAVPDQVN